MPGAPGDPWPLMPQTPARAIPGVRLEHDHRAHLSESSVLHHPLIAGGTIVSSERGLAGVRAQALDMVTQRGYSHRSVALPGTTMGWYTRVNAEVLIASPIAASSSRRLA